MGSRRSRLRNYYKTKTARYIDYVLYAALAGAILYSVFALYLAVTRGVLPPDTPAEDLSAVMCQVMSTRARRIVFLDPTRE
ncbi:MAG: hypothetical protein LPL29_14500 [Alphaproteobacteria bacterium]|nr:hypothetical protein [Alphaproteobacteria bacterium]